jgi:hypothetical protein
MKNGKKEICLTFSSRISGKVPVIEQGFTCPTTFSVALHNTSKPRDLRSQATPDDASLKVTVRLLEKKTYITTSWKRLK